MPQLLIAEKKLSTNYKKKFDLVYRLQKNFIIGEWESLLELGSLEHENLQSE